MATLATLMVNLKLDASQYTKGVSTVEKSSGRLGKVLGGIGKAAVRAGKMLAVGLGAAAVAVGVKMAKTAGDFESQMNILAVAARSAGTGLEDLQAAAIAVGADTELVGISASEAADAMTGFYKAGLTTTDIFGDLEGYLERGESLTGALRASIDLAAASELDLAAASDLVAVMMATFGLSAEEATSIADSFVQAADASVASVGGLAEALKNVGPTAAAFGWSLGDTNTALAILSTRGIEGAEAGTALKSMMTNLMRPTDAVTGALDDLGVSLFDQTGKMRDLPDIIGDLGLAMEGLTEEQRLQYVQTLAGTFGMKAMQTLLDEGAPGWKKMEDAISGAASAQEVAEARTKGFNQAMENLGGVIETVLIQAGLPLIKKFLTPLVDRLSDIISKLPEMAKVWQAKFQEIKANVESVWARIQPIFQHIWNWVGLRLMKVVRSFRQTWVIVFTAIRNALTNAWNNYVLPALQGIRTWFVKKVLPALVILREKWLTAWDAIKSKVQTVWERLRETFSVLIQTVRDIIPEVVRVLFKLWVKKWELMYAAVVAFWSVVWPVLQDLASWLQATIPQAIVELRERWTALWSDARMGVENFVSSVQGYVDQIIGWFKGGGIAGATSDFGKKFSEVMEGARKVWATLVELFEPSIARIVQAFDEMKKSFGPIMPEFQKLWEAARPVLEGLVILVGATLVVAFKLLLEIVAAIMPRLGEIVGGAVKIITGLFHMIGEVLGGVVDLVKAIIDGDWSAAWEAAKRIAVGVFDSIVMALEGAWTVIKAVFETLYEAIVKTFEDLRDALVGKSIIPDMVDAIIEWIQRLPGVLLDILSEMVAAVRNAASGLLEAGAAMMSGLLQGILSKAAEIVAAAVGIIKDAIAAAWAAIRGASPSRVFMNIGESIGDGLALGITKKIGRVVAAIRQMFKGLSDAARADLKDFIEVLSSLGAGISGALAGLSALRDYDPRGGLPKRLEKFASDMHKVIVFLRNVAQQFKGPGLESAKAFAEAAGAIGSSIVNAIAGLVALAGFEKVAGLRAKVEALANQLQTVVGHIRRVSRDFKTKGLESAKEFAEAVGPIVDMIAGAVQGIKDLLDYQSALNLPALAAALANDIGIVIGAFRMIGQRFEAEGLDAAAAFATAAGAVMGIIGVALEAIPLLAEYVRQEVAEAAAYLATDIADIVDQFSEASDLITTVAMDKASAFASGAATVFAFIKTSLDVIALLREYSSPAAEKTQKFLEDVERIVGLVAEAVAAMFAIDQGGRFAVLNLYLRGQMAVTLWLQGMIDGIHAKAPAVIAAIQALINDLVGTAEKTLGIASPSEAFSDIGALTMQGLVDGILSRARDALQAMTDLIERISGVGVTDFYEAGKNSAWEWLRGFADAMRAAELVPVIPATMLGGMGGMTAAGGGTTAGGDTYNIFVTYRNEQDEASLRDTIRALQMAGA